MNRERYRLEFAIGDGLARISSPRYGAQPWARRKARVATTCQATGKSIKIGDYCYGPIDNGMNRSHRVREEWVALNLGRALLQT